MRMCYNYIGDIMIIGSHVGFNKNDQLIGSIKEALSYGSTTFMFYTGAPQNTSRLPINKDLTLKAYDLLKENNIDLNNIVVHAPYIINPANNKNLDFNVSFLKNEIKRVEELGVTKMVLHPGSHVGLGIEQGLNNIIECLNLVLNENTKVHILLETMAGKGTELGYTFEQLKTIIDGIKSDKVGVCMDTCHMFDAGLDISDFDKLLDSFDKIIGLEKLECIHINDSKNIMGSHKDRHENIGLGNIGFDTILKIVNHDKLKEIPKILETPYTSISGERIYPPYKFEIDMLKSNKFNENLLSDIEKYYNK